METEILNHVYYTGMFMGFFAGAMIVTAFWWLVPRQVLAEDVDEHLWHRRAEERRKRERDHAHHSDYPGNMP